MSEYQMLDNDGDKEICWARHWCFISMGFLPSFFFHSLHTNMLFLLLRLSLYHQIINGKYNQRTTMSQIIQAGTGEGGETQMELTHIYIQVTGNEKNRYKGKAVPAGIIGKSILERQRIHYFPSPTC